jgi:uncharacterized cupredoxin-like copper-binding protein
MAGMDHGGASTSGAAPGATSRVNVVMRDIAYVPDKADVKKGSTVTFAFKNDGQVAHDAFIGDVKAQASHEAEMRSGNGAHGMVDANSITVEPGKAGELNYTFNDAGTLIIGCHEPGHYDAGMKITVTVT